MKPVRLHAPPEEAGFTLIEVLISTVVLGVLALAVGTAIILFFRTADGTANRLSLSHDSQLLTTYLLPDLDSLGQGQPIVTSSGNSACGPIFSDLKISFAGVNPSDSYRSEYAVTGPSIVRMFTHLVNGVAQTSSTTTVVHNLKAGTACFSGAPGPGPWTMTLTVEASFDTSTDYTFSVTGGRATAQPALCSLACASPELLSKDTNNNGKIDQIIATFDEPLNTNDTAGISEWVLSGQPVNVTLGGATVSGNTVILTLNEGTTIDTVAAGLQVAFLPDPQGQGVRNQANQPAIAFQATPVSDGMAPVLRSMISQDADHNGKIDHVVLTFSEAVLPLASYTAGPAPWNLSGQPSGVTVKGPDAMSGNNVVLLALNEGTGFDTLAAGFQVGMNSLSGGVRDGSGNLASFGPRTVDDGMAPVRMSMTSQDFNQDGKVDRVVMTFSEPLFGYTAGNAPWTLSGQPAGVTLDHVAVTGNTVTLFLIEGTTIDTTAAGFQVALAAYAAGVHDNVGNVASFGPTVVTDGMGPVVVGLASTNASGNSSDHGRIRQGDTLTLNFCEALDPASLPSAPLLKLIPGQPDDQLSIAGVALIDLGNTDQYFDQPGATYSSSLSVNGGIVTIVVGSNIGGAANVRQAVVPSQMIVKPLADPANNLPKDVAGNVADGQFVSPSMVLF